MRTQTTWAMRAAPLLFLASWTVLAALFFREYASGPKSQAFLSATNWYVSRRPVRIIVQECCRHDLVDIQVALFDKFLEDPYEMHVVVPHGNTDLLNKFHEISAHYKLKVASCPHKELAECYDFSYQHLVANYSGLIIFANDDMFLWKPWSASRYFHQWDCDIVAMIETHNGEYLHPGFHMLDTTRLPTEIKDMTWGCCDVGARTIDWIKKHPDVRVHPLTWSRNMQPDTLAALRLIPMELAHLLNENHLKFLLKADLYLENFSILHLRGSSEWAKDPNEQQRVQMVLAFLRDRLADRPLTWSDRGASTERAHVVEMRPYIRPWPTYSITAAHDLHDTAEHSNLVPSPSPSPAQGKPTIEKAFSQEEWMSALFAEADKLRDVVAAKKQALNNTGTKLPLPATDPPRTNLDLSPPRYDPAQYRNSTVYYWKYVYNSSTPNRPPEFTTDCGKKPGQKYWIATYAAGNERLQKAKNDLIPSCRSKDIVDEIVLLTPDDLDAAYKARNARILSDPHGVGNWIWKHYVEYNMIGRMNDGDILFYMDSDMKCSDDLAGFYCLADKNDVTPFHHSHPWYTLSRLARRDALVFMGMDREGVAHSVQYSGGSIFFKKTPLTVQFVRELAAWSQQPEVVMGYGQLSEYSIDWPEYLEQKLHQCDQTISSLLIMKYGIKSYPWMREGFGSGSDDDRNAAERAECGMPLNATVRLENA